MSGHKKTTPHLHKHNHRVHGHAVHHVTGSEHGQKPAGRTAAAYTQGEVLHEALALAVNKFNLLFDPSNRHGIQNFVIPKAEVHLDELTQAAILLSEWAHDKSNPRQAAAFALLRSDEFAAQTGLRIDQRTLLPTPGTMESAKKILATSLMNDPYQGP